MKKFLKNIAVAAAATLVVGTFSVGAAAAATGEYDYVGYVEFNDYSLADKGGFRYTDPAQKSDYYDYAVVYIDKGVSSYAPVYFATYTRDGQLATSSDHASDTGRYTLDYKSGMGNYGDYYKLRLSAGYSGLTVSGKWAP